MVDDANAGAIFAAKPPSPAGSSYVSPDEFDEMKAEALAMGFPMLHAVRLSALLTTPICRRKDGS